MPATGPRATPAGRERDGIVGPFVLVIVVMILLCVASLDVLSAARAFVGGESHWSKAQKVAVSELQHYLTTFSEHDYQAFLNAIAIPQGDRRARIELNRPSPDMSVVNAEFMRGGIDRDDVPGMARLYRHAGGLPDVRAAVGAWTEGDELILELTRVAADIHRQALAGERDRQWIEQSRDRIRVLDARLTPLEYAFSDALGKASRETAMLLRVALCAIGALLVLVAARRARRLLEERARMVEELRASDDRYRLAVAGSNDGLWDWDRGSRQVYLSPRLRQMLGMPEEQGPAHGMDVFRWLHPEDRPVAMRAVVAHVRRSCPLDLQFRVPRPDGRIRWYHARGASTRAVGGMAVRTAGSVTDITERREADALLFAAKERAEVTLQSIGDAVITTDARGCIEYLNPSAERLTRWSMELAHGLPVASICGFVSEANRQPIPDPVRQVLQRQAAWGSPDKLLLTHADGWTVAVDLTVTPIRDRQGATSGVVLVMRDVSSEREHAAQLSYQASHDPLTGLINRREFERRLVHARHTAQASDSSFAVLYVDLDQFKVINDTCSHAAGDELLRQVASLFGSVVRPSDAVARLGGDEFVLLLEGCDEAEALVVAERLRTAIGDHHFAYRQHSFVISASIGMVSMDASRSITEDILGAADAACHLAKEKGRNRVQAYRLDNDEVAVRQSEMCWVARLQRALSTHRFVLYAQDIIDLRQPRKRRHFELLLRMRDEDGSLIPPRAFIPAAERYGLMPSIDRWVVQAAFTGLRTLAARDPNGVPPLCSINLSGTSLCDVDFTAYLREQFALLGIAPSTICFEITETAAISSLSRAIAFIEDMRALGCRFSLDDFGAGMSSFTYLKHLPVDFVKIEGSFVKDMLHDPIDYAMVEAINKLGHATGKRTIAECVSSEPLLEEVRRLGIDYAQGFVVNVPRPFMPTDSTATA
jgi:diguanylate cyclase (GGDEF)-like protein/PAS domain S-box-containing protein